MELVGGGKALVLSDNQSQPCSHLEGRAVFKLPIYLESTFRLR